MSFSYRSILRPALFGVVLFIAGVFVVTGYQNIFTTEVKAVGGNYTEGIVGVPRFINPVLAQSNADRDLTKLVFSSLINIDNAGNISYGLAEGLNISEDQKTYTLSLHPDAKFSDGTPISARDLVFTIEKIQSPLLKSPLFSKWTGINAQETGAREVTFTLVQPYADFIYNLAIGVLPEHRWKDVSDEEFIFSTLNTQAIGSGSYSVETVQYKESGSPQNFSLTANKYALAKPYIKDLNIKLYSDSSELLSAYKSGYIQGAYGVSPSSLENINPESVHAGSLPRTFGIFFNTENNKPTLNAKTRAALSHAINRKEISQNIFNNYAYEVDTPFGLMSETSYSPEKTINLLIEAGWKQNSEGTFMKSISGQNTPLSFTLSVPNIQEVQDVAEIIKTNLQMVGVSVSIKSYEQSDLANQVIRSRDYDALLFGYVLEKPSDSYAFWHSSQRNDPGLNISMYNNPKADAALLNIRNQQNREDDIAAFLKIWEEDMPAILLYSPQYIYLGSNRIDLPSEISNSSERFNNVNQWYQRTRHIWNFLIKE